MTTFSLSSARKIIKAAGAAVILVIFVALAFAPTAAAQSPALDAPTFTVGSYEPAEEAGLDAAVTYWRGAINPKCAAGPVIVHDPVFVGKWAALGEHGGCRIYVGSRYMDSGPLERCHLLVHEYGHLVGHDDNVDYGDVEDPERVMVYNDGRGTKRPTVCDTPHPGAVRAAYAAVPAAAAPVALEAPVASTPEAPASIPAQAPRINAAAAAHTKRACLKKASKKHSRRTRTRARARCLTLARKIAAEA